jgi:hypothetical protein
MFTNSKLPTAKECRDTIQHGTDIRHSIDMDIIIARINEAVTRHAYSCSVNYILENSVKKELSSKGYTVKVTDYCPLKPTTTVSWS